MNPNEDPLVLSEIEKAQRWIEISRQMTDGISFQTTNRLRITQSYLRLSLEHQLAIFALMKMEIHASGKALLRPQFDAFARGLWFMEKASDEDIARWIAEEDAKGVPPRYERLIKDLDSVERFETGYWSKVHSEVMGMLHDFTHGGKRQINAFNSRDEIVSNFKPQDIFSILRASALLGWLAANEMLGICGLEDRALELQGVHREIYGEDHGMVSLRDAAQSDG